MPSLSKQPLLKLLPSLPIDKGSAQVHPAKWDINREALLDAAPDWGALLLGDKSIKEIRQLLNFRCKQARRQSTVRCATTGYEFFIDS